MEKKVTDIDFCNHIWELRNEIVRLRSELHSHPTVESDWYKAFLTVVDDVKATFAKIEDVRNFGLHSFLLVKDIYYEFDCLYDENDCTHEIDEVFDELYECREILIEKGPTLDEFIDKIMDESRENTLRERNKYYDVLVRDLRCSRNNRSEELTPEVWGERLREDEEFLLSGKDDEGDKEVNQMLVKMSKADTLCCPKLKNEYKEDLYRVINADNVLIFFKYALHINILLSETFPDTLKPQFEAWLKGEANENPETAQEDIQEEKKEKKKGGNRRRNLFRNDKDKEEAVKCVLEYIQSQPDLATLKNEDKPLLNSCWTEKDGKLNKQILAFLIEWEKEEKIDFSAPAVFRFLKNDCSLKNDCEQNSFINKLLDNWNTRK